MLYLFNQFELEGVEQTFRSDKSRALLAYLVIEHRQLHSRMTLATLLWSELPDKQARANLRLALHNLRQIFSTLPRGNELLETTRSTVRFHPYLDVDALKLLSLIDEAKSASAESKQQILQQAIQLYTGDFCRGLFVKDGILFEEWHRTQRERFHQLAATSLSQLIAMARQQGDFSNLQFLGNRLVALMPSSHEGYAAEIESLIAQGEKNTATLVYQRYRAAMDEEGRETSQQIDALLFGQQEQAIPAPTNPNNVVIPASLTPFFGRKKELKQLQTWLLNNRYRMITLVGMGGIGKTRLALEAARQVSEQFVDGVFFVPLAGLDGNHQQEAISEAIASTVGLKLGGARSSADQVADWLEQRDILVVIDNWEHLVESADILIALLAASPGLTLLCTSQVVLNFQAERVFELEGLPVPESMHESVDTFASIQLLYDRAEQFVALDALDAGVCVKLCDMVGGHPLAIELAAAALRDVAIEGLVSELEISADSLAVTFRDLPPRQRSIRALLERSWALIPSTQQDVMQALAIMRGAFSEQAAVTIAETGIDTLFVLYDKSLIQRLSDEHFSLHSLIRQFALERLSESNKLELLENQHAHYYLGWVAANHARLIRHGNQLVVSKMKAEYDNIRAAWQNALHGGRADLVILSARGLCELISAETRLREGLALFSLPFGGEVTMSRESIVAHGWLQCMRAYFTFQLGHMDSAENLFEDALAVAEEIGNERLLLQVLHHSNDFFLTHHEGEGLGEQLQRTAALATTLDEPSILGATTLYRGASSSRRHKFEASLDDLKAAEQIALDNDLATLLLETYAWQSYALTNLQRWDEFHRVTEAGIALAGRMGEKLFKLSLLSQLAGYHRKMQAYDEALAILHDLIRGAHDLEHAKLILTSYISRAELFEEMGRYDEALDDLRFLHDWYEKENDLRYLRALSEIGRIYTLIGNPPLARKTYEHLLERATHHQKPQFVDVARDALHALITT